jgi:hypothetical protein
MRERAIVAREVQTTIVDPARLRRRRRRKRKIEGKWAAAMTEDKYSVIFIRVE